MSKWENVKIEKKGKWQKWENLQNGKITKNGNIAKRGNGKNIEITKWENDQK